MNIQELKERVIRILDMADCNIPGRTSIAVKECFEKFESSSKEEPEIDDLTSNELQEMIYSESKHLDEKYWELFSEQDKKILAMQSEIDQLKEYNKHHLECENVDYSRHEKMINDLKQRLKPVVGVCEPKQKRFYYQDYDYYGKKMFEIVCRDKKININLLLNNENHAIDICKALNALEAEKHG